MINPSLDNHWATHVPRRTPLTSVVPKSATWSARGKPAPCNNRVDSVSAPWAAGLRSLTPTSRGPLLKRWPFTTPPPLLPRIVAIALIHANVVVSCGRVWGCDRAFGGRCPQATLTCVGSAKDNTEVLVCFLTRRSLGGLPRLKRRPRLVLRPRLPRPWPTNPHCGYTAGPVSLGRRRGKCR